MDILIENNNTINYINSELNTEIIKDTEINQSSNKAYELNYFNNENNKKQFKNLLDKHSRISNINIVYIEKKTFKSQNEYQFWSIITLVFFEINNSKEKIDQNIDLFNYIFYNICILDKGQYIINKYIGFIKRRSGLVILMVF